MKTKSAMGPLQQKAYDFLVGRGWKRDVLARTRKYIVMTKEGKTSKLYLGKQGAVRKGTTVGNSYPVRLKYELAEVQS